jgi:hypothetical protein
MNISVELITRNRIFFATILECIMQEFLQILLLVNFLNLNMNMITNKTGNKIFLDSKIDSIIHLKHWL